MTFKETFEEKAPKVGTAVYAWMVGICFCKGLEGLAGKTTYGKGSILLECIAVEVTFPSNLRLAQYSCDVDSLEGGRRKAEILVLEGVL